MAISDVKQVHVFEQYIRVFIKANDFFPTPYDFQKNFCYSFTYLEFIEKTMSSEENYVVLCQLRKSYILTGMSIVEGILYYIIKSNQFETKESYEVLNTYYSNEKVVDGETIKIESRILKKLKVPKSVEMNLDSMLKKAESKKLLGEDSKVYGQLNHLRKLRNKIHIHVSDGLTHDFNSFTIKHYQSMKKILYAIVKSEVFNEKADYTDEIFDFLKI